MYDGRAALWHHESTSRVRQDRELRVARSRGNRERFVGSWGPRLTRVVLLDAISGDAAWSAERLRVAIAGTPPPAVHAALADRPWELVAAGASADVTVVADPAHDVHKDPTGAIRVGWIEPDAVEAWLGAPALADSPAVTNDPSAVERLGAAFGPALAVGRDGREVAKPPRPFGPAGSAPAGSASDQGEVVAGRGSMGRSPRLPRSRPVTPPERPSRRILRPEGMEGRRRATSRSTCSARPRRLSGRDRSTSSGT
jgi:hypothetical protein